MGPKPPNFALLIGKRLDKKGGGGGMPPPEDDGGDGPSMGMDEGGAKQEDVENSAMTEFMAAKDPGAAKAALWDLLEAHYPDLQVGEGGGEPDGDEGEGEAEGV